MALSEFERRYCESIVARYVERHRPPVHLREKVDLAYRIDGQSVEIFEIRPLFQRPLEKIEEGVAKATYVRKRGIWRVFWRRADLKWHRYDPEPEVRTFEEFIELVERDEWNCFYG